MHPLGTRTPGSSCFHITAFLSEAKLSLSHRYSAMSLPFEMLNTLSQSRKTFRDQSNPTDSFASHILSRTKTEHSMTFRPEPIFCCAWSMSLRPSPHCTTDSHRLLCCYSCRVPSVKGEEVQSIFVLLWDQLDVSSNYAAVI